MVLNPNVKSLGSKFTRGALARYAFAMENSGANLAAVTQSHSFFNRSVVFNNYPITDLLAEYTPSYMDQSAKALLQEGLAAQEMTQLDKLTVLIPSDISYSVVAENINQLWQKELGLFFTLELLPNSEITRRVTNGDFDIAFFSSKPVSSNPATILLQHKGFGDDIATHIAMLEGGYLSSAETIQTIEHAHNDILEAAYVVPMCTDTSKYIHKSYFKDIDINPFGNIVNLKYATVK